MLGEGGSVPIPLSQYMYIKTILVHLEQTTDMLTLSMTGVAVTCDSGPSS